MWKGEGFLCQDRKYCHRTRKCYSNGWPLYICRIRSCEFFCSPQLLNKNGDLKPMKKEEISAQSILGATFEKPSPDMMAKLKIDHGMQITDIKSGPLQRAGIKKDFIITEIDHNPINSIEDIENALVNRKGAILIEGIYPNGIKAYYAFTI